MIGKKRRGNMGDIKDLLKRKRKKIENKEEKEEEDIFRRSKKVVRSPIKKTKKERRGIDEKIWEK